MTDEVPRPAGMASGAKVAPNPGATNGAAGRSV